MQLEVVEEPNSITRVVLDGRLDSPGVDAIETRFNAALTHGGHGLVDMSGVSFLSSMGVRMLISAAKAVGRRGHKLVLVAPQELVAEALQHSSIDELIPVAPDLDAGRALLG
ncbi:MAG: STAS domain-containing protein [Planctomycetota bacterium]